MELLAIHKGRKGCVRGGGERCPTAMPGQERGDHWGHAWRVVQTRNYRIRQESGSVHFHVAPLLKSTTGLDMERLVMLVKKRNTKINGDRELINMDKEAAEALFSSEASFEGLIRRIAHTLRALL